MHLVHSRFRDSNLVLFHMWWEEIVLKPENVCKYFVQDCLQIFLLVFTSLKMLKTPIRISFQYKKVKPLNKYYPATIGMIFSAKFVFDAKIQRRCFLKYTKYAVSLNISFRSKLIFSNTKMYKMYIPRGLGRVKNNNMFCFRQCWTKYYGKTMYNKFFLRSVLPLFFPNFLE